MSGDEYLLIYSNCIPVKGVTNAVLIDFQTLKYFTITTSFFEFITFYNGWKLYDIYKQFNIEELEEINEYIRLLVKYRFARIVPYNPYSLFPKLSLKWDNPSTITNAIIDFKYKTGFYNFKETVSQLSHLGCESVQIRFLDSQVNCKIAEIVKPFDGSNIKSIQFIIPFFPEYTDELLIKIVKENNRLHQVVFYNCNEETNYFLVGFCRIIKVKTESVNIHTCGVISNSYFAPTIEAFTEAQHHNTCLNRKISIDSEGNIKNCPSMPQSFGNIRDTTLEQALAHPDFKKYWNVKKDDITKCKDCEFRYICTDCRAYIDDPDDMYSAPLKCGYDPYTGVWEEWSTNPLKQKAITYYGMEDLVASAPENPDK